MKIKKIMVMVECLCGGKKKEISCDPEDRSGGYCYLCAGHKGEMKKWISYNDLLEQISKDLLKIR